MDLFTQAVLYLRPGGIMMLPIIIVSLVMWALIIERAIYFQKIEQRDISLEQAVELMEGKLTIPIDELSLAGLRARMVANFLKARTGSPQLDLSILEHCTLRERPELRRYIAVIAVLAAVAPLLGLLGTVSGMMTTFNVISIFGTGNAKAMAGGISEALLTTQSGLLVAIPGLYMSIYLSRHAKRLEDRLDEVVLTLKRFVS
ncbi:MAG: MotA/TolQ/ExbB proton channel family protein [Deltaproteobacteria bacterium]|nr:MotA/TolQ/ExbB proton channel family protein [Deltaproteobacteria bacterium]